jgi:hypothetical protein
MSKSTNLHENAKIIRRMTDAGVPRNCWSVSTSGTGRARYREFAEDVVKRGEDRDQKTSVYVRGSEVDLDVEIIAKELVLAGVPTQFILFNKAMRDLRIAALHGEEYDKLAKVYSRGAIVLPNVPGQATVGEEAMQNYLEMVEYLVSHVHDGGVLVLGGSQNAHRRVTGNAHWPAELSRVLLENAITFEVP